MEFTVHQWEVSMHVLRSFFPRGKSLSLWLLTLGLLLLGAIHSEANTNVSFTLPAGQPSYLTSAAVYDASSGVMIRQLWKYVSYAPGLHTVVWDDKDDSGNTVSGTFTGKVLYHNMNYIWDGAIANSSQDQSGYNVHRGNYFVTDMAITGTSAMYASGNFEGPRDFTTFTTTAPRVVTQKINWLGATNWNPRCGQVTGANGSLSVPVVANLNMNFAGATGKVHIIWGGFCQNTKGGAKLTVTDNTAGTSFTSPAYPAMAFQLEYNQGVTSCHTVFKVGSCQSMTISVVDNNDWNQLQRAYIQAVWVENGGGSTATTYDTTTVNSLFDIYNPPTYDVNTCMIGGSWLTDMVTPYFTITRTPPAGFALTCPAVGGGTQSVANADFKHAGLIGDTDSLSNWNTNTTVSNYMATDGVWFYGATSSSYDTATERAGLIIPMWVDNGHQAYFLNGQQQKPYNGYSYNYLPNAIRVGTQPGLAGIAVQTTGNILAASVPPDNKVYLFDKRTGSPVGVGSITVTAPGRLAMTPAGDLWVLTGTTAVRYTNLSTTPSVATTITGFSQPLAVAVSPVGGDDTVIIADGGTKMQLLAYTNTGTYKWTYGQQGGYQTNGPTVSNDKLWFANDAFGQGGASTFVTYQPDGSFWVGDAGNYRSLHLSADRSTVLDEMAFQTLDYNVAVDMNNPTRVFNTFKEYQIDYSKPIAAGNGSWTLVKNWRAGLDPKYWQGGYFAGLVQVVTFPQNGRTYSLIQRQDLWHQQEICELTATGVRPTGVLVDGRYTVLDADGSMITNPAFNNIWMKQTVTGFDGSGNPQYSAATELARAQTGATDPIGGNLAPVTSTGVLAALDSTLDNRFHLGGVQTGTTNWLWRAFPAVSTAAYEDGLNFGDYDIGDGITYPANRAITAGRHIVCDFHGEFWKQSQAGQFMHFFDNGLFVGQYGTSGHTPGGGSWPSQYLIAGFAGNAFAEKFATVNNELYMWVNDESGHGPQRWHLSGINSINVLYGSGATGGTITTGTLETKTVVATPTYNPVAGTYTGTQSVTISTTTSGATIRYTTDGSTPSETVGTIYTAPVSIGVNTTLKAIAYKIDMADSAVASGVYNIQCATPTYNPTAGTYSSAQTVTISCATSGVTMRYTTDGSTPSQTVGTVYSTPVSISVTCTLKAIAYNTGMTDSAIASGVYTISGGQCATPTYSPVAGTYTGTQTVTISCTTAGVTMRYTTDGTTPSQTVGTVYSTPVSISVNTTLKAIAYKTGMTDSAVASGVYNIKCATPTYNPAAGTYTGTQTVTISCTTAGVTMRYTTDGSTPSQTVGTVYSTPVSISVTCTLKAIAFKTGMTDSTVASGLYTINLSPTYQAVGTVTSGTGAITPTWPTHQAGDVALLVIESANQAISLSTPAGFVEVTGSPQGTGTAGGTAATRLAVYWKRATTSSESSPTVADSGDHQIARIITFRGVIGSGNPWDVTAGGVAASASTAVSIPGATTTVANTLVVTIVANGTDTTSAQTSGWTNANLTSLTERMDNNTSSGNGGGFGVATGVKATAGAYGATTATLATSSVQGKLSIALKPAALPQVPTSYIGTRQVIFDWSTKLAVVTPTNFLFGGGFYDNAGVVTLQTTPAPYNPSGFSLSASGWARQADMRLPTVDMSQVGLPAQTFAATDNSTPVVVNLNMNIPDGQSAILHIAWGYHCNNTQAGGDLTVVDNTNGVTFNSLNAAVPNDFKQKVGYNENNISNEMTFTVGSCRSMTITLAPYNDWNQTTVADIQAIWLVSVP